MSEYDDYDYEDFDSTEESGHDDAISTTNSTVDAVTALLLGESEEGEEGEGKDNAKTALYDHAGEAPKTNTREFQAVELDRHGNRVFDGQQEPVKEVEQPSHEKQEILYQNQIDDARQQAAESWEAAHTAMNQLQAAYDAGRVSEDDYQAQSFALGQQAGAAKDMAYRTELAGYQIKEQREQAHKDLENLLGEEMWGSDEARSATIQSVKSYCDEMQIDPEMLQEIEDPAVARALATAAKNHVLVDEQKAEIAKMRSQIKRLKSAGKVAAEKAKKSMGVGAKRDSDYAINEVTKLLMESGNGRGGR